MYMYFPSPRSGSRFFVQMAKLHGILADVSQSTMHEPVDDSRPLEIKVIFTQICRNLARHVLYYCVKGHSQHSNAYIPEPTLFRRHLRKTEKNIV